MKEPPLLKYDDIIGRREMWEKLCAESPIIAKMVNPTVHRKNNALCVFCGTLRTIRSMHQHVNLAECMARRNTIQAMEDGYIMATHNYYAGSLHGTSWAQPFLRQYKSGTQQKWPQKNAQLAEQWWARDWWLPIAAMSRKLPDKQRHETMTTLMLLWEAGRMEEIDALVGGMELMVDP